MTGIDLAMWFLACVMIIIGLICVMLVEERIKESYRQDWGLAMFWVGVVFLLYLAAILSTTYEMII